MKSLIFSIFLFTLIAYSISTEFDWNIHHDNSELLRLLKTINSECSNITHLYNLKFENLEDTILKNKLWVIVFGKNPTEHSLLVPEFKYIGNIHGNEVVGRELILRFANELCQRYLSGDEKIQWIIHNTRINLLPAMNPDGYQLAIGKKKHEILGRTNANKVDLNRNFPNLNKVYFHNKELGIEKLDHLLTTSILKSHKFQTETWLVMNWIMTHNFVLSASMHGGDLVANYPFDTSPNHKRVYTKCEDDDIFVQLADAYSFDNHKMFYGEKKCYDSINHFFHGRTNGAKWYPVDGGMQDFNYLASNCFEITLELGCEKYPEGMELNKFWKMNSKSMYDFMLQVHNGVKGVVLGESLDGLIPVPDVAIKAAKLQDDLTVPIKHNIFTSKDGDYFRLLTPGHYIIWATKIGYQPAVSCIEILKVTSLDNLNQAKVMNFVLKKEDGTSLTDEEIEKGAANKLIGEFRVSGFNDDPICHDISSNYMFKK